MFLLSDFTPPVSQKFQDESSTSKKSSSSEFFQLNKMRKFSSYSKLKGFRATCMQDQTTGHQILQQTSLHMQL